MFRDEPKSIKATMDVTDQIELDISSHFADTPDKYHLPVYVSDTGESPEDLFDRLCEEGIVKLYGGKTEKGKDLEAARVRLAYEKSIIVKMGFISYFLIVWDIILWSRANGVSVGPGRGSAAGSLIAYALDITRVCPLEYDLLFERFLNEERVSMPDIDIDFCKEGRERVIEYTREKYGRDCVTQIVTFGTMASRTVVRDVGRVLDLPLNEINKISKKIPTGPGAPPLAKALEEDSELQAFRDQGPRWKELFQYSVCLEGMSRHVSTHAAGVVITPGPTVDYVPLGRNGDDITTQYPAPQLEELEMANHGRHVVLAEGACSGQLSLWFPKGYRVYTIYVTNEPPSLGA